MKKFLSLTLVLIMVLSAFALTACPGPQQQGEIPGWQLGDATFDPNAQVTIKFYSTIGKMNLPVIDAYIEKFMQIYPNIIVEHTQPGGYDEVRDQIKTELTVGEQPNIAYCYPDHVAMYNRSGKVITLDQFIKNTSKVTLADGTETILGLSEAQVNDFIEGFYNEGRQFGDGHLYTLPFSKSSEVLYYNKTFFEQHNLKVPTTWDEMEEVCRQIKAIDPSCTPLGYDSEANWFITMTEQYKSGYTSATGDHYIFDNATNQAFVERFAKMFYEGLVTTQEIYGGYTSELFKTQKSYMGIGSTAGAGHQVVKNEENQFIAETGIAPIPQIDPSNPKVISQGPSLVILDSGDVQENIASWLFMKYLTTDVELQAIWAMETGYVPVLKSVVNNDKYAAYLASANGTTNVKALSAKICMEQTDYYYASPAFNGSSTARDQVGNLMQACFVGFNTKVKEYGSVDAASASIKELIDKAFKDAINECENQL